MYATQLISHKHPRNLHAGAWATTLMALCCRVHSLQGLQSAFLETASSDSRTHQSFIMYRLSVFYFYIATSNALINFLL